MFRSIKITSSIKNERENLCRKFSSSKPKFKIIPKNLKSKSSHDWLTRHLNDPYVKLASRHHYRARSAFKLIEIDEKFKLLAPGKVIVECGAAPGAWTQVIVSKFRGDHEKNVVNGKVISIDLRCFEKVDGAIILPCCDFKTNETQNLIEKELNGKKADLILSDMAPDATGSKELDHPLIIDLAYSVLNFAIKNAKYNSHFLCKVWDGYKLKEFKTEVEKYYKNVKFVKPNASRSDSAEIFVLGRNFLKIKS